MGGILSLLPYPFAFNNDDGDDEGSPSLLALLSGGGGDDDGNAAAAVDGNNGQQQHQHQQGAGEDLVDWDAVLARIRNHPEEAAAYCHSIDPSPLQLAVSKLGTSSAPPVAAVRALLDAYDDAAYHTDEDGNTALHCAVRGGGGGGGVQQQQATDAATTNGDATPASSSSAASKIVDLLLEANPEAASRPHKADGTVPLHHATDEGVARSLLGAYPAGVAHRDARAGQIPLHRAVESDHGVSPGLVRVLVEEGKRQGVGDDDNANGNGCGGVLFKDRDGATPLDLICARMMAGTFKKDAVTGGLLPLCPEGQRQWDVLTTMILTGASPKSEEHFLMVHTVIELGLPPPVVSQALRTYPVQARERDSKGRTPLMIAASKLQRSHSAEVIQTLLHDADHGYKAAARMTDADGRLPIDIAAESGVHDDDVLSALVMAEPRAVDTRDLRDKMFPFMTAAIGEKSNISNVYRLLREKPHVLSYFYLDDSRLEQAPPDGSLTRS